MVPAPLPVPSSDAEGAEEPAPPAPLEPAVVRVTFPGEPDPIVSEEPTQANEDGSYTFDFERSFERVPGAALMDALVNEPAIVVVVVGETELARCVLDLAPFTTGAMRVGHGGDKKARDEADDDRGDENENARSADGEDATDASSFLPLDPVPFPVAEPTEEGGEAPEPLPSNPLLPTAAVAFSVTASNPFVEPEDAERGLILTLAPTEIAHTPPSLSAYEDLESYPFVFAFGVPLPGLEPAVVTGGRLRRRAKDATRGAWSQDPQGGDAEVPEGDDPESETPAEETYVSWFGEKNASKKFWLPASSVDAFRESIKGRGKKLRFEVARYPAEAPETTPDPVYANYHAVAEVALEALVEPGATSCAPRRAFLEAPEYGARSCLPRPAACPDGAAAYGDEPAVPPGAVAWAASPSPSRVAFAVTTTRPLLPPFRPPAPTETTLDELLPARADVVVEPESVEAAAAREFREEVTRASMSLAEEYAAMFTGAPAETDAEPDGAARRRKQLVFELNRSGKYHDMKERLKDAASKIVKSRFFARSAVRPDDREELDAKYDELYVHLVEEMHAALADLGSTPEETARRRRESEAAAEGARRASLARQKNLADEYEINDAFRDAEKWHQERVLLCEKKDASVWCAYGAFLARRGRHGAAEEAFKEALVVDESCVEALRALCCLMLRDEEYHRAEVFGQAIVTAKAPGDAVAWTLLALAYDALERETDKDNCAFEARRLTATAMANLMGASPRGKENVSDDFTTSAATRAREKEIEELVGPAAHVKTALLCLDMHAPSVARRALDLGQFDPDDAGAGLRDDERLVYKLCSARAAFLEAKEEREKDASAFAEEDDEEEGGLVANEPFSDEARDTNGVSFSRRASSRSDVAFGVLMDALSIDATDPRPFELLGDVHALESRYAEAEEAYTHAMACSGRLGKPPASLKLFLNLGDALLRNGKTADARGAYAAACEMRPCASTWIGLGKAMIGEGDLEGAEAALAEANVLDSSNPNAWTQLAIVSLLAEPPREDEAERAIGAAFKRGAEDSEALADVARLFLRVGGWKHAEAAARRAVKHGAGVETRLCLARASRERGDAEGAAAELKYALALAADEGSLARTAPRGRGDDDDDDDEGEGGGGAVGVPFLVPELLEELAGVYDELGDARRAEECRRDLRALEREQ